MPSDLPNFGDGTPGGILSQEFHADVTKLKICSDTGADCELDDGTMPTGAHVQSTEDFGLGSVSCVLFSEATLLG